MPINKNAYFRYILIDRCLTRRNNKYHSTEELLDYLYDNLGTEVSLRTLQYDIEEMKNSSVLSYYAPIAYSKTDKGYYYTEADFSIGRFIKLNDDDYNALKIAGNILDQYRNVGFVNDYRDAVEKINSEIKVSLSKKTGTEKDNSKLLFPESAPYVKGHDFIEPIINAILDKKKLKINYTRFQNKKTVEHLFNAYSLKEYNKRWYVIGFSENGDGILNLALDRISELELTIEEFEPYNFNTEEYYKNYYGITINPSLEAEKIEISFTSLKANYLKTRTIHHSQILKEETTKESVFEFFLIPNYEFMSFLLSCAGEIKIIKPESLKIEYSIRLKNALSINS